MRILRISHSAVVDAWRLRERLLRADGHEVSTVCAHSWNEAGRQVSPRPADDELVVAVRTLGTHPALFVYDPLPLWRLLGQEWDLVDLHEEPFALCTAEIRLIRRLRRCRAPFTLYSAQNIEKRYPLPFRLLERAALRTAAGVQTCNEAAADICERKGFPGRARVIPLGVDLDAFGPAPARSPGHVVGYAGRLADHKGVSDLFDAVEADPTLHLRVAGDGPLIDELAGRAGRPVLLGRVEMLGALPASELADFYRSVDVLAVPSRDTLGWREQFGRVAVEAMACGTPVVASATGALPEVLDPAALLVPERDPAALRDALRRVLDDPATSARCRELGLRRAAECSWPQVHEQFLELYRASTHEPLPPTTDRTVHVVLVAFHRADLVDGALAAVQGLPVVVVDNSADEQVREVAARHGAQYVDSGGNLGFAGGVNIGLRRVPPTADVLLLNPDARLAADDVLRLQRRLLADPGLASVSPSVHHPDGGRERVSWPLPHPLGEWVEALGLGSGRRSQYVIGAVLLLRAEALAQVGPFDAERFFLYAEETDWAARALRLGWRHAEAEDVVTVHEGAATSTDATVREAHFHSGKERYLRKHHGAAGWQSARAAVALGAVARAALLRGDARRASARRARTFLRGPMRVERALTR